MSNITTTNNNDLLKIESALISGDLKDLRVEQRLSYYKQVCESLKLNPVTKPFDYICFQGKVILYPNKNCAEQLRARDNVTIKIISKEKIENIFCVTVSAKNLKTGREDEASAYLDLAGLTGNNLANALMKTETKAKRRVTLSICGLGMTDEAEWEGVENAIPVSVDFDDKDKIAENVINTKATEQKEEKSKFKNEAPISIAEGKRINELIEVKQIKTSDIKSTVEQLWGLQDHKLMKIWQAEVIIEILTHSGNRDDFGKNVMVYQESKLNDVK